MTKKEIKKNIKEAQKRVKEPPEYFTIMATILMFFTSLTCIAILLSLVLGIV